MTDWRYEPIGNYISQVVRRNNDGQDRVVVSVTKYRGIVDSLEYFDKQVFSKDTSNYKVIRKNEFAYATIHLDEGSIGYLKNHDEACLSPMYTVFSINEDVLDKDFLFTLLKTPKYIGIYNHLGEGTVERRASISFEKFSQIEIPIIPLAEQKKITSIFSTVDGHIEKANEIFEDLNTLKAGLMQQLFTRGIGQKEFKETEVGVIPKAWEVKKLGEVVTFSQGLQVSLDDQKIVCDSDSIRFLRIVDYTQENQELRYIKKPDSKHIVSENDVIMVRYGASAGFVGIGLCGAIANNMFRIIPNDKIVHQYLYYFLKNDVIFNILNNGTGASAMPAINFGFIANIKIVIPSVEEQEKIARILLIVDENIKLFTKEIEGYITLKEGLIQKLLSGKIRVKHNT